MKGASDRLTWFLLKLMFFLWVNLLGNMFHVSRFLDTKSKLDKLPDTEKLKLGIHRLEQASHSIAIQTSEHKPAM